MALSRGELQVLWSTAATLSVTNGTTSTSDAMTLTTAGFNGHLQLQANNDGTPASGDTIDFFIAYTVGDPGGSGADVFDSTLHAKYLGTANTFAEDPAIFSVPLPVAAKAFKILAKNNATANEITVSAAVYETRG